MSFVPPFSRSPVTKGLRLPAVVGLIVVPLLLLTVALEIRREFDRGRELRAAVNHSYEKRLQMLTVFSLMQDAETGSRGYVITGQKRFLEPYNHAAEALGQERRRLRALQEDELGTQGADRAELGELDAIEAKIDAKLARVRLTIAARDTRGAAAAQAMVSNGIGKQLMDELRVLMAQMASAERQALTERVIADEERTHATERVTLTLFLILGALLFGAFVLILLQGRGRQRLLEKVELNAARMTAIFDSAQDGLLTFNLSGTVESLNRAGQGMFGYGPVETLGRDASMLFDIPEDGRLFLDRLGGGRDLREGLTRELQARRNDGSTFPAEVSLGRFDLASGAYVVAAVRDMSERRRIEQMKSEFVSTVSHELRTPLTSIAGSLGLLAGGAGGELSERTGRLVGIAHANSQRLVRLINDILDTEKIESGQMTFAMEAMDVVELARRALDAMQGLADELGVKLVLTASEALTVRGDADRLAQVLTNLLSNAAKFSPKDATVEVSISRLEAGRARVSVRDHGPGVPESFRQRIFSKFAQADGSDTRRLGGTGLGLAICREIVERHGGRIFFDSPPGEGATFHVDLPLFDAGLSPVLERRQILICEDDPDAAMVLSEMAAELGLDATVVGTLAAAEAALREPIGYIALLLDLRLPDGHGLDLLKRLRSRPGTSTLPVLIVSGEAASPQSLDVLDWLQKPVDIERLKTALANARRGELARLLVLHVEDDPDVRQIVATALRDRCDIIAADSVRSARRILRNTSPQLAILDVALGDGSGLDLLPDLRKQGRPPVPVIVFTAQSLDDGQLTDSVDAVLTKSRSTLKELSERVQLLASRPPGEGAR
ncbi:ATP-binding protein [Caulobacter sp. DWR2-3-1b2]|uniref:ATP-binding protein n=1 Tax=unclassified Caulobacter TaxID=2648921 RepID=UPI003CEE39F2